MKSSAFLFKLFLCMLTLIESINVFCVIKVFGASGEMCESKLLFKLYVFACIMAVAEELKCLKDDTEREWERQREC